MRARTCAGFDCGNAVVSEAMESARAFLADGTLPVDDANAHPGRRVTVAKRVLQGLTEAQLRNLGRITVSGMPWLLDCTILVRGTDLTAPGEGPLMPLFIGLVRGGPTMTFTSVQPWRWLPMTSLTGPDVDRALRAIFEMIDTARGH